MRGLLIVNPRATSMTGNGADLVLRSLSGLIDLDVACTRYRGHARELAAATARDDVVIVFGGDGAVNEVVNGLMNGSGSRLIAVIPGGGGNVFAQALGLPRSAAKAIGRIRELLMAGQTRTIGLGLAADRYFTFSAGIGMDAEVVHEVEDRRARGSRESASLFARGIVHRYYRGTDRRRPALTVERDGQPPVPDLFMGIVTSSAPWTYVRGHPVLPVPDPDFSSGLDLLALSRLRASTITSAIGQMMCMPLLRHPPRGRHIVTAHHLDALTISSSRPIAWHVDGEYLGETESVKFQYVPDALRVVAPGGGE